MTSWEAILKHEFDAEDGSFLLQLRCELTWDKQAFNRLTQAMLACVQAQADKPLLERWIAQGFWYIESFTRDWSSHPSFPKEFDEVYYKAAYERLYALSYWLFNGENLYLEEFPWTDV